MFTIGNFYIYIFSEILIRFFTGENVFVNKKNSIQSSQDRILVNIFTSWENSIKVLENKL